MDVRVQLCDTGVCPVTPEDVRHVAHNITLRDRPVHVGDHDVACWVPLVPGGRRHEREDVGLLEKAGAGKKRGGGGIMNIIPEM